MFDEIELVDPDKDKCGECGCSFGVHLKTCSHFYMCEECRSHDRAGHFQGCSLRRQP